MSKLGFTDTFLSNATWQHFERLSLRRISKRLVVAKITLPD